MGDTGVEVRPLAIDQSTGEPMFGDDPESYVGTIARAGPFPAATLQRHSRRADNLLAPRDHTFCPDKVYDFV